MRPHRPIDRYTCSQKEQKQNKEKEKIKKEEKEDQRKEKIENEGKKKVNGAQRKSTKDEVINVIDVSPKKRPLSRPKPKKIQKICALPIDLSKESAVT